MIPTYKRGDRLTAVHMNEIGAAVRRLDNLRTGNGLRTRRTHWGQTIELVGPPEPRRADVVTSDAEYMIITEWDFADHVVCLRFDDAGAPIEEVKVAKPWELRRSSWDGKSYPNPRLGTIDYSFPNNNAHERQAAQGSLTELEVPVPFYTPGTRLKARQEAEALTGDSGIKWLDLNDNARAWAVTA